MWNAPYFTFIVKNDNASVAFSYYHTSRLRLFTQKLAYIRVVADIISLSLFSKRLFQFFYKCRLYGIGRSTTLVDVCFPSNSAHLLLADHTCANMRFTTWASIPMTIVNILLDML